LQLVEKLHDSKLLSKMFNLWRNRFNENNNMYGHKNKALIAIWNCKVKDVNKDMQRAFTIWRESSNYQKL